MILLPGKGLSCPRPNRGRQAAICLLNRLASRLFSHPANNGAKSKTRKKKKEVAFKENPKKRKSRRITKQRAQAQLRKELNRDFRQRESAMKGAAAKIESFKRYLKRRDGFIADP